METLTKIELDILFDLVLKRNIELQKAIAGSSLQFKQAIEIEQRKLQIIGKKLNKISELMEGE